MSGHLQALEEDLSCVIFAKETSNFNSLDRLLEVGPCTMEVGAMTCFISLIFSGVSIERSL